MRNITIEEFDQLKSNKYLVNQVDEYQEIKKLDTITFGNNLEIYSNGLKIGKLNKDRKLKFKDGQYSSYVSVISDNGIIIYSSFYNHDSIVFNKTIRLIKITDKSIKNITDNSEGF